LVALIAASVVAAQKQDDVADTTRLIEVLAISTGDAVADIGAGDGVLTVPMARHVGPSGRVYSTDINPQRLIEIRAAVAQAQLQNVVVVEGGSTRANIPTACCDAIFMRHVYHHFGDPALMNTNLMESLKAGGRLAVVDFPPDGGISAQAGRRGAGQYHGVMPQTVIDELRAAGFIDVAQLPWPSNGYFLVIARRAK
jgi:ubiquinone/menaquinone biosynthesis C-methylase UbiE